MRTFHFLDAVCLFMLATFILLETDASPKPSNTKLKNKGPTSSGNAKLNADPSPKTSVSNTKLENEPAAQKNPGLTVENQWNSKADACHADLTLSQPVQPSDPKLSKPKRFLVVKHKPGQSKNCSSVFAVQPIPKEGIFYYEVTILGKTGVVSIGLGPKQMPLAKEIGFEGYAYQSCGTFLNHEAPGCYYSDMDDKPRALFEEGIEGIRPGNVVGCGVDFKNKKIFYTLNGERLGPAGEFVDSSVRLFPCVSLARDGDEIEANFGPDFEFKTLLKWDEIVNKNLLPKD